MAPLDCMIVPAPMNPMPVTTCAAMRPGSPTRTSPKLVPRFIERSMISAEPRQIRMLVRRPEAFPAICALEADRPAHQDREHQLAREVEAEHRDHVRRDDNCETATITLASVGREWQTHPLLHVPDRRPRHSRAPSRRRPRASRSLARDSTAARAPSRGSARARSRCCARSDFLQSMQPHPAVRQFVSTSRTVASGENALWSW